MNLNHSYRTVLTVLASFVMVLGVCRVSAAATLHVPADYPTIQEALDAASNGDEIVVAPGNYAEWDGGILRNLTLRSSDGPASTIINGGGSFSGLGSANNTIQGFTFVGTGSGYGCGIPSNSLLDDCVFTQFNTGVFTIDDFSGAPIVTNCTFDGNVRGIFASDEITIAHCTFRNQTSRSVEIINHDIVVTDCLFENNAAPTAAAIRLINPGRTATITNTVFVGNTATAGNSGTVGGDPGNTFVITGCTFTGNSAAGNGGALAIDNGTITASSFTGNSASRGGALHLTGSVAVSQCTLTGNHATMSGGGIWMDDDVTLALSSIDGSTTDGDGGGITMLGGVMSECTITNNTAGGNGGGVHIPENTAEMVDCELSFNTAAQGGALSVASGATLVATDSILCGNLPDEVAFAGGFIAVNVTTCSSRVTVGACCLPYGGCAMLAEDDCAAVGGTYFGDETECEMVECPAMCSSDTNADGVVDVIDLLNVLAAWGSCL